MTSERQLAANRANAKRSTGPRTAAGKISSSRNALRHGLSLPIAGNDPMLQKIARSIAEEVGDENFALEMARSAMELSRIRQVRDRFTAELASACQTPDLKRLIALQRYTRLVFAKRKRVIQELVHLV